MYAAVAQNLLQGLLRPRTSARRMLDYGYGMREIALLVVLGYLIGAIFSTMLPPVPGMGSPGVGHLMGLFNWVLVVLLVAWFAWLPPRLFGGQGSWAEALRATAWLSVLINLLWPIALMAVRVLPAEALFTALVEGDGAKLTQIVEGIPSQDRTLFHVLLNGYGFAVLWLFASFVAEIHRFTKTWLVLVTIFGINIGLSMMFGLLG